MDYTILVTILLGAWVLNFIVAIIYSLYIKNNTSVYYRNIVETGKNIFVYGLIGMIAIALRMSSMSKLSFFLMLIVLIVFGILAIIDILRLLVVFFTSFMLLFNKNDKGVEGAGRLGDWIFIISMLAETTAMVAVTLHMLYTLL